MGKEIRYCGPVWFDFTLQPPTIAESYRLRWPVELLFDWIMKHLRIEAF
ncbi:transposase [Gemmatimonadota bacterium]